MAYLDPVKSPKTAKGFLRALHKAGLLYHCEESARDCLDWHNLPESTLQGIEDNMHACFQYLPDPCQTALNVSRD